MNLNEFLNIVDDNKLFMYFLQNSTSLEDNIERLIREAYIEGLRCTQIDVNYCIKHNLFQLDYDDVFNIIETKENIRIDNSLRQEIKDYMQTNTFFKYIYECIADWYRMVVSEMNTQENVDISDARVLKDLDDKKGDIHTTGNGFSIDAPVRDYPFVYYDGHWLNWDDNNHCKSHDEVINLYFGPDSAKSVNLRDIENIKDADPSAPVIFGDSLDNIGFIEAYQNISEEEAAKIYAQRFKKVYKYVQTENYVQRLAKRI